MENSLQRPTWDQYFMKMAYVASERSPDPHTKHGAVLVNKNNQLICTAYNGPIQNIDDSLVPLTRPDKYYYFLHSEENLILFGPQDIQGFTVYVTGRPCPTCTRMLIQKKVGRVVFGPTESKCIDTDALIAAQNMIEWSGITFEEYHDTKKD